MWPRFWFLGGCRDGPSTLSLARREYSGGDLTGGGDGDNIHRRNDGTYESEELSLNPMEIDLTFAEKKLSVIFAIRTSWIIANSFFTLADIPLAPRSLESCKVKNCLDSGHRQVSSPIYLFALVV